MTTIKTMSLNQKRNTCRARVIPQNSRSGNKTGTKRKNEKIIHKQEQPKIAIRRSRGKGMER
jgi:hypothetical protein